MEVEDVGLLHPLVCLRCEYGCTHRHVEHPTREIIGNPRQHSAGNLVVIDTAPEQLEIQLTPPFTLCNRIVVETLAKLVRFLNLVCHNLLNVSFDGAKVRQGCRNSVANYGFTPKIVAYVGFLR